VGDKVMATIKWKKQDENGALKWRAKVGDLSFLISKYAGKYNLVVRDDDEEDPSELTYDIKFKSLQKAKEKAFEEVKEKIKTAEYIIKCGKSIIKKTEKGIRQLEKNIEKYKAVSMEM
jgi:hypothetical protein